MGKKITGTVLQTVSLNKGLISVILLILFPLLSQAQLTKYKDFPKTLQTLNLSPVGPTKKVNLQEPSEYKVIIFWASWCNFCDRALQDFARYNKTDGFAKNKFSVVAISVDTEKKLADEFFKNREADPSISYSFLEPKKGLRDILQVTVLPTIYIVDKNNQVLSDYRGYGNETAHYLRKKILWYVKNENIVE
ncbi:thiol-disulfide oxidoreductase [compost metagenome]